MTALQVGEGEPVPPALMVERVERRERLSVAFRLLLALPQAVVLYALSLAGSLVIVLGWFAALVLGRLPEPFARYLCHLTRYSTRVYAYYWLLTDRYPPFRFSAEDYPVEIELAPGRLNRLAVLFRLLLVIPASILASLAIAGWTIASFFIWLWVLVTGRVPGPLFDATTAILRYNMRLNAYNWLVTSAYPWGFFGDRPIPTPTLTPTPTGFPEFIGSPVPVAVPGEASLDATAPAGPAEWLPPPPRAPRGLLVLSAAAKRLLVLFIVLGVLWVAGGIAVAITTSNATTSEALSALTTAHNTLADETQQYQEQVAGCRMVADALNCVQSADRQLADGFDTFASEVAAIDFPTAEAEAKAAAVERLAHDFAGALRELATASSPAEYTTLAPQVGRIGNSSDQQYQELVQLLTG